MNFSIGESVYGWREHYNSKKCRTDCKIIDIGRVINCGTNTKYRVNIEFRYGKTVNGVKIRRWVSPEEQGWLSESVCKRGQRCEKISKLLK